MRLQAVKKTLRTALPKGLGHFCVSSYRQMQQIKEACGRSPMPPPPLPLPPPQSLFHFSVKGEASRLAFKVKVKLAEQTYFSRPPAARLTLVECRWVAATWQHWLRLDKLWRNTLTYCKLSSQKKKRPRRPLPIQVYDEPCLSRRIRGNGNMEYGFPSLRGMWLGKC